MKEEEKKVCKKCGIENCKCGCNGDETKCVCSSKGCCGGCHSESEAHECKSEDGCGCENRSEEIESLKEQLKRTMADFINFKRRNEETYKVALASGVGTAILAILPCLDAIESAEKMYKDETIKKGLKSITENFEKSLESLGVKKIKAIGEEFNPEVHNAVLSEEKKGVKAGIILEELQAGYIMNEKVIRYSVVKVSK